MKMIDFFFNKNKKLAVHFAGFLCLIFFSVFISSCGPKNPETLDAGFTDSINAKYKDNAELQKVNAKILENPSVDSLYRERAYIYVKLSDFGLAEGDAKRALKIDSLNSKNYLILTEVYYAANQTRKAKETLERCIKNLPKDKEALLKLAELYFYVKKYQESIDLINRALTEDQYLSKAYFLKGMNYMEIGDTSKAVSSMLTAVEQDNNYYTAYMQLATLHYYKKSALCLDYYDNALRISPNSTEALYGKAKFLQDIKKIKEAKNLYLQILSLDAKHKNTLYNMGAIMLSNEKNYPEAKKYFSAAIEVDPNYTEAWFARGVTNDLLKDKEAARGDLKMALKISPNYEPALTALNKLEGK